MARRAAWLIFSVCGLLASSAFKACAVGVTVRVFDNGSTAHDPRSQSLSRERSLLGELGSVVNCSEALSSRMGRAAHSAQLSFLRGRLDSRRSPRPTRQLGPLPRLASEHPSRPRP